MKKVITKNPRNTKYVGEITNQDHIFAVHPKYDDVYILAKVSSTTFTSDPRYNFVSLFNGNLWSVRDESGEKSKAIKSLMFSKLGHEFEIYIVESKTDILTLVRKGEL